MSPAKVAEPIVMLFERLTRVGPGNHELDGDPWPVVYVLKATQQGQQ